MRICSEESLSRMAVCSVNTRITPPRPRRFPQRNRLISGFSDAVFVVQLAGFRQLGDGKIAQFHVKTVMALPGLLVPEWAGSNQLLRDGDFCW